MSDNISPEIVRNILTRLPVKSLLRFRCVCKPWFSLIDSPNFVNSHLTTKSNYYVVTSDDSSKFHLYSVDGVLVSDVDFQLLSHMFASNKYKHVEVVGSVNGIVCFTTDRVNVLIWNPATRKLFRLPPVSSPSDDDVQTALKFTTFGFGYDSVGDDFKVVRLDSCLKPGTSNSICDAVLFSDVKVFSLKSKSWTRGKDFPHPLFSEWESGRFVCGALHWCLSPTTSSVQNPKEQDNLIIAFNLGSEEYHLFTQPNYPNQISHMALITLEGSLGLVCDRKLRHVVDVWVMKEYGVKDSWTRMFSVSHCQYARPLCYSRNGQRVLLEKDLEILVWYDLEKKKYKKAGMRGTPGLFRESFLYVESMIRLPSLTEDGSKKQRKMMEDNAKKRDEILIGQLKLVL